MKNVLIALIALVLIGGGIYYYYQSTNPTTVENDQPTNEEPANVTTPEPIDEEPLPVEPDGGIGDGAGPLPEEVIGTSAEGNDIVAYHYGTGSEEILFIGGIHGGYSPNTSLVAFEIMDYLDANAEMIPEDTMVTVIPVLNPDGLAAVTGTTGRFTPAAIPTSAEARVPGRFNGNTVDLNRNFDCEWQSTGTWQDREVDGGSAPFSEPEAAAIRDYVANATIAGAVVYYSQAGGVYSSTCRNGIDPVTADLTNVYAEAAGYPAYEEFDYYEITGDMVNWMAGEGIPGISVLLSDHTSPEWSKNQAGVAAVLEYFATQ